MDTDDYYTRLEPRVGRQYKNRGLLRQAMTAPATEEDNYEGHRSFAQIGEWLLQFILGHRCLQMGSTRGEQLLPVRSLRSDDELYNHVADINDLIRDTSARDHRASVAISMGLGPFIKCSPRQKEGPSNGTLSSTISAIVYATWSDSGGDWIETVKVMRHIGIYPINSTDPKIRPDSEEELIMSSDMSNAEPPSATCEQEHTDLSMNAIFRECITPSALDLTSAGERQDVINAGDSESPDKYRLSASRSSTAGPDSSIMLIRTPDLRSTPSPDSHMWVSLTDFDILDETQGCKQARNDLHDFESSVIYESSPSTRGSSCLATGTRDSRDCDEREGAPGASPARSSFPTDYQGALIHGDAYPNEYSSAASTTATNTEEKASTSHTPDQKRNSLPQNDCDIVATTEARPVATSGQNKRRRKTSSQPGITGSPSSLYIAHERRKVLDRNLRCPEDFFTTRKGQTRMMELDLEDYAGDLKVMNFTLGGCETFAVLGDVLRAYHQDTHTQLEDIVQNFSLTKRLKVIHNNNGRAAYHVLLRNLHILYFTREATALSPNISGGFIQSVQDSQEPPSKRPRGNPLYLAEATITKNVLTEVYPDVDEGNAAYNTLYREVKGLRKYGRRLDKLVKTFGFGILGLIPLIPSISTADQAFETTYKALFATTDKVFNDLIVLTDECQGQVLRMLAKAAQPLIEGILHQRTNALAHVGICNAPREIIMQYPKGASELVKLLSQTSELRPQNAEARPQDS